MKLNIKKWESICNSDNEFKINSIKSRYSFLLNIIDDQISIQVFHGSITIDRKNTLNDSFDFELVIPQDHWKLYTHHIPERFHNTFISMITTIPEVSIRGSKLIWARNCDTVERVLSLYRLTESEIKFENNYMVDNYHPSGIIGRYIPVQIDNSILDFFYLEAGVGQLIIFLHTAGSDSRQFKYILGNKELQKKFHMVAFDIPYHGMTDPPRSWWSEQYQLSTELYVKYIQSFLDATTFGKEKPIIVGSSMGGSIVIWLASEYGSNFKAAISIEGCFGKERQGAEWSIFPDVNGQKFLSTWEYGLTSPYSCEYMRRLVTWEYSQGAPGVYLGDLNFYANDWPKKSKNIKTVGCPIWFMTGEYDYSCTAERSKEAAEKLGGKFIYLKGLGHFPMAENPNEFLKYLKSILNEIIEQE